MDTKAITFDNFALKAWLRKIGPSRRCEILRKLRNELKRLGLARSEVRKGLLQLATRPHVTLSEHPNTCGPCLERSTRKDRASLEEASDARDHWRPETAENEMRVPEAVATRPEAGAEPCFQEVEQSRQGSRRRSNEKLHAFDEQLARLDRICLTRISNKGSQERINKKTSQERIASNRRRASDGDERLRNVVPKNGVCSPNSRAEETRIERMDGAKSVPELSDTIELFGPRKWIPERTKIKLNLSSRSQARLGQEAKTDQQKMADPSLAPGLADRATREEEEQEAEAEAEEHEEAGPETAVEKVQGRVKKLPCRRILVDSRLNYVIEPRKREESEKKKRTRSSVSPVPLCKRPRMLGERGRKRQRDLDRRIKEKFRACFGEYATLSEDEQEQMILRSRKRRKKDSVDSVDSMDSGVCLSRFSGGEDVQRAVPDSTIRETDEDVCQSPKEDPFEPYQGHGEELHFDLEESSDRCSPDTATGEEIPSEAINEGSRIDNVDNRIDKADSVMREFINAIGTDKGVRETSESEITGGIKVDDTVSRVTGAARIDDAKNRIGEATRITDTDNEVTRVDDTAKANDTKNKITGSIRRTETIRINDAKLKIKETSRLTHRKNKTEKTSRRREATRMDNTKNKTAEAIRTNDIEIKTTGSTSVTEAVRGNDTKNMITKAAKMANTDGGITEATVLDDTGSRIREFTGTNNTDARIEGAIDIRIKELSRINNTADRIGEFCEKKNNTDTRIDGTEDRITGANCVNKPDNRITDSSDNRITEDTETDKPDNRLGESTRSNKPDDRIAEATRTSSPDEASKTRRVDNRDDDSLKTNEIIQNKRDSPAFNKTITLRHSEDWMEDKTEPSVSSKSKQLLDVDRVDKNVSVPLHVISIEGMSCPTLVNPALAEAINNTHMELSLQNDKTIRGASTDTANNVYAIKNGSCSVEKSSSLHFDNETVTNCSSENYDRTGSIKEIIGRGNYAILDDSPVRLTDVDDDSESEESRLVISMEDPDKSVSLDENEVSTSETLSDHRKNDGECPSKIALDTNESIDDDCIILEGNSTDCPLSAEHTIVEDETDKENRGSIEVATEIVEKSLINNETIKNSERATEVTSTTATEDKKDKEEANSDKITIVLEKTNTNFKIKSKQDLVELLYSNLKDVGHIILNGHVVTIPEENNESQKYEVLSKDKGSRSSHRVTKEISQMADLGPFADKSLKVDKETELPEDVQDVTKDKAEETKATETGTLFKLRVLSSAELGSRWCLTPAVEDTQDTSSTAVASGLGTSTISAALAASVTSTTSPTTSAASVSTSSPVNNAANSAVSSTASGVVPDTEIPVTVGSSGQQEVSKECNRQHCLNSLRRIGQTFRVIREAAQAFTMNRASPEVDQILSLKEIEVKYKQATRELVKELHLLARLIYSNSFLHTIRVAITTLNSKFFAGRPLSVDEVLSYTSNWTKNFQYAGNAQPRNETGQELLTNAHNKPSNGQPVLRTYSRRPSSDAQQMGASNLDPRYGQFEAQTQSGQFHAGSGTGSMPQVSHPVPGYTERAINQQPSAQWSMDQAKAFTQDRRVLSDQNYSNNNNKQGLQNPRTQNFHYGSFVESQNQSQHFSGSTVANSLRNSQNPSRIPYRHGPEVRQPNSTKVNNVGQPYSDYFQPYQQTTDKSVFDSSRPTLRGGTRKTEQNRQRPVTNQRGPPSSQNITYLMQPRNSQMGPRYQGPTMHPLLKQTQQPTQQQVQQSMQQQTQRSMQQHTQQSMQQQAQQSIQQQAQQQAQRCTQQDMQQPMQQFVWQPVQDMKQQPMQQQMRQPIQQLVQQPIQQLVQQPIQQPMQQLAHQSVQPLVRQPVQQPQRQPVQQLVRQPVRQPQQQPVQQFMQPPREPNLYMLQQLLNQPTSYPIVSQPAQQHFLLYTQHQQQPVQQQAQFVLQPQVTQPVHRPAQQLPQQPSKTAKERTLIEAPNGNTPRTNLAKDSNDKTVQDSQDGLSKSLSDKPENKSSESKSLTTLQKIIFIQQIDFHCRNIKALSSTVAWENTDKIRNEIACLERLKDLLLSSLQEILERDPSSEEKQKDQEKSEPKSETADALPPATNKQERTNEQEDNRQEQMQNIKELVRNEQERATNEHDRPTNEQERLTNEEDQATIELEQAKDKQMDSETFVGLSMPLLEDSSRLNVVKVNESNSSREKEPEENGPGSKRVETDHEERNSEHSEMLDKAENETVPEGESREEVEKKKAEEASREIRIEETSEENTAEEMRKEVEAQEGSKEVVVEEGSEESRAVKLDKEILVAEIVEEIQQDREVNNNIEVQKAKEGTKGAEEVVAEQEEAVEEKETEGEKAVEKREEDKEKTVEIRAEVGEGETVVKRREVAKQEKYVEAMEKLERGHKVCVMRAGDLEEEDEEIDVEFVDEESSVAVCPLSPEKNKQAKGDGDKEEAEEEDDKSSETEEEDQDTQTESEQDTLILSEDDSTTVPDNFGITPENPSTNSPVSVSSAETASPSGKPEEQEEVKESSEPEGSGSEHNEPKEVDCDSSVAEKPSEILSSLKEEQEGSSDLALNIESIETITMEAFEQMDLAPQEMESKICLNCCKPSTVVCEQCLDAQYCSKRCSELHWVTHYKDCRRHAVYSTIEQPSDNV